MLQRKTSQATYLEKMALANYILRGIGDGMEMAHSVEGRPILSLDQFPSVLGFKYLIKYMKVEKIYSTTSHEESPSEMAN